MPPLIRDRGKEIQYYVLIHLTQHATAEHDVALVLHRRKERRPSTAGVQITCLAPSVPAHPACLSPLPARQDLAELAIGLHIDLVIELGALVLVDVLAVLADEDEAAD